MAKYYIQVSGPPPSRNGQLCGSGVYDGGKTIVTARKRAADFDACSPADAQITIVRPTTYKDVNYNPYEERYAFVEQVYRSGGKAARDVGHVLEIIGSNLRHPGGPKYLVRVPDIKNRRGYDLVDVIMHFNGAVSTRSANNSASTSMKAIRFVRKHLER